MHDWVAIIIIVGIIAFARMQRDRYRFGGRNMKQFFGDVRQRGQFLGGGQGDPGPSPREVELETELARLTERVKVLERIATAERGAHDLAQEIERLREH